MPLRVRRTRSAAVAALVVGLALQACGRDGPTAPPSSFGNYTLVSVNGCAVGIVAEVCPGIPSYAAAGTLVLGGDGSARREVRYRFPNGDEVTVSHAGTFRQRGAVVTLAMPESYPTLDGPVAYVWRVPGRLAGDDLTLEYADGADGMTVELFRRTATP